MKHSEKNIINLDDSDPVTRSSVGTISLGSIIKKQLAEQHKAEIQKEMKESIQMKHMVDAGNYSSSRNAKKKRKSMMVNPSAEYINKWQLLSYDSNIQISNEGAIDLNRSQAPVLIEKVPQQLTQESDPLNVLDLTEMTHGHHSSIFKLEQPTDLRIDKT